MARSPYASISLLAILLCGYWMHAIFIPFWQDDYHFLLVARDARESGEGWLSVFWPSEKSIFWRPLSEGLYWRVVEDVFDANPIAAHAINLLFHVAAALAVAWLVSDYAQLIEPKLEKHTAFLTAGLLYGMHSAHFIPVAWATAVHTSMMMLFSSLALRFWVSALRNSPRKPTFGLIAIPLFLTLALLSKENGILALPLGALLTAVAWQRARPTQTAWIVALLSVLLAIAWLILRREMVVPPSGSYEMGLGANTLRNLSAAFAFFFNVPRESLRFILEQHSAIAALWAFACGLLQAIAVWIVVVAVKPGLNWKGGIALAAFFLMAVSPHLLFSWNSYAYYIVQGLVIWPFLAVTASLSAGPMRLMLCTALLSSGLSVAGNRMLDYPALLARADWADRQLTIIRDRYPSIADQARTGGIDIVAENRHKFLGIGLAGLAFTLDLPRQVLREVQPDVFTRDSRIRLIFPAIGNAYFEPVKPTE